MSDSPKAPPPAMSIPVAGMIGVLVGAITIGLGFAWVKKKADDSERDWRLEAVVVAARDLPVGTVLRFDDVAQRQVPRLFLTESVVRPGDVTRVLDAPLLVPLKENDPLPFYAFASATGCAAIAAACERAPTSKTAKAPAPEKSP